MVPALQTQPSAWVRRFAALVHPRGAVLDVACGSGRHAGLFADAGYRVTAIDRDLSRLAAHPAKHPAIEAIEADLEDGSPWPLPGRAFDGIVGTNYLNRPLFPILIGALAPGGVLIWETFAAGNERYGRPRNPDFLLADGELLAAVAGKLRIVAYEAGLERRPGPAVVQRIAAIRPGDGEIPPIPPPG